MSVVRWQPVVVVSTIMVAQRIKSGEEVSQATKSGEVGLNKILSRLLMSSVTPKVNDESFNLVQVHNITKVTYVMSFF